MFWTQAILLGHLKEPWVQIRMGDEWALLSWLVEVWSILKRAERANYEVSLITSYWYQIGTHRAQRHLKGPGNGLFKTKPLGWSTKLCVKLNTRDFNEGLAFCCPYESWEYEVRLLHFAYWNLYNGSSTCCPSIGGTCTNLTPYPLWYHRPDSVFLDFVLCIPSLRQSLGRDLWTLQQAQTN